MRPRTLATVLALAAVVVLATAACGGGSDESAATTTSAASGSGGGGGKTTLRLAADPGGALRFDTTSLQAQSGKVTIDFTNQSSTPHNVTIEGNGIDEVATDTITDGKSSLTADLPPGTYTFFCSVDGHEAAGMKGTLKVS